MNKLKKPIKIGLLGAGRIANAHANGYLQAPEKAKIVALADVDEKRAKKKAKLWGVEHAYTDYLKMLRNDEVDAIDICLPHQLHLRSIREIAKSEKPVLIEKPLARNLEEAREINSIIENEGNRLMVAHNHLFNPLIKKAVHYTQQKYIGNIFFVSGFSMGWFLFEDGEFRLSENKTGGGVFIDTGIHFVYLLEELAGPIRSITASKSNTIRTEMQGEDNAVAVVNFESGILGEIVTSYAARLPNWEDGFPPGWEQKVRVYGNKGTIEVDLSNNFLRMYSESKSATEEMQGWFTVELDKAYSQSFYLEIQHFLDSLLNNKDFRVDLDDGLRSIAIVSAFYESAQSGKRVNIPDSC